MLEGADSPEPILMELGIDTNSDSNTSSLGRIYFVDRKEAMEKVQ